MLNGKRIVITGANGGIGNSICEIFLKNNAKLVLLYNNNRDNIDQLLKNYKNYKSNVEIFQVDLLNDSQLQNTANSIISTNNIDGIVHCVTLPIVYKNFLQKTWKDYQMNIELQTKSFLQLVRYLIPSMKKQNHGKIINILSSVVVGKPISGVSDYIVGKYSLLGLSKALSTELGPFNINVNCISPSMTNTPLIENFPSKLKEITISQTPLGRIGEKDDVASLALFLCSNYSNYITGENILLTGGQTMY
ncbi:MAG: SDR family oxidoreductase [Flavobacteriaceae bacterium]|jgi:3-oxoacyl-[acyl-carrier protein] reductase|nr:SDR family oxidoreductase [Flavobacteriaceae bacterium]